MIINSFPKIVKDILRPLPKMEDPEYYKLRNYALDFLFNRFAHDDVG
ncbi:hypothetical protein [Anabaenopsis arnoldii]